VTGVATGIAVVTGAAGTATGAAEVTGVVTGTAVVTATGVAVAASSPAPVELRRGRPAATSPAATAEPGAPSPAGRGTE